MTSQSSEQSDQDSVLTVEKIVADSRHPHQRLDCRLKHTGGIQKAGFLPWTPHELQSNGQACNTTTSVDNPVIRGRDSRLHDFNASASAKGACEAGITTGWQC